MGKGPAVIRLIEHWERRQKKRSGIVAVPAADAARSLSLHHCSSRFREAPTWCVQTLGSWSLELAETSRQAVLPATTPQDKSAPPCCCSRVVLTEVEGEGEQERLVSAMARLARTAGWHSRTEEEILLFKSFHRDVRKAEYFQIWKREPGLVPWVVSYIKSYLSSVQVITSPT